MKLIALVPVVVLLDGARKIFEPGEEVTGLNEVDIAELKKSGCIEDQQDVAKANKADAKAEADADAEFAAARAAVLARQESTEASAPAPAPAAAKKK
jgi:hypothetical protein